MSALRAICKFSSLFASFSSSSRRKPFNVVYFFFTTDSSTSDNFLAKYLIEDFKFSTDKALLVTNRYSHVKSLDKPNSTVRLLQQMGFSDGHILSSVHIFPQMLFVDAQKILRPKLLFFQEMGLSGYDLGVFISKRSAILSASLDRRLRPCADILKKVLSVHATNENLLKVIRRSNRVISSDPNSTLLSNISFFGSLGIVGSQLSMLLRRQPRLFVARESVLQKLASQVLDMGFSKDSRMFVHGLHTVSCISQATLKRKFDLLQGFGFSEAEILTMFRKIPTILRTSDEKLKAGINFFMSTCKFNKAIMVDTPTILVHSIESRIMPRYRVLQTLKVRGLLKRELRSSTIMTLRDDEFLEMFILRFKGNTDELMKSYMGEI